MALNSNLGSGKVIKYAAAAAVIDPHIHDIGLDRTITTISRSIVKTTSEFWPKLAMTSSSFAARMPTIPNAEITRETSLLITSP